MAHARVPHTAQVVCALKLMQLPTVRFVFSLFVCLVVSRSDMRGTLPDLGNMPRLEALFLHQNQISGTLSVSKSMKWLDVTSNRW